MLQEHVEDVEPEAVDAAVEPAADHPELGLLDRGVPPVQVRLLGQERVEVELAAGRLPRPGRSAEERDPVVRAAGPAAPIEASRIAPQVPVGEQVVARGAAGLKPGVLVARVIYDEIEHDPQPAPMGLPDQPVELGLGAEAGVDRLVIADVVADVEAGRRIDRRQPDGIDAEAGRTEVIEVIDDAAEVAGPVTVGVGEAARVDLVDDAIQPPSTGCIQAGGGC